MVPAVAHGYDPHHLDFPGVIHVDGHVFVRYLVDICKSLIHHGFTRIIMLNGHGSNTAFTEVAARLAVIETEGKGLVYALNHWGIAEVRRVVAELRDSPHGGMSHGGELETSLYLAIDPENVYMDKAAAGDSGRFADELGRVERPGRRPPSRRQPRGGDAVLEHVF